jgi:hypothetical protein
MVVLTPSCFTLNIFGLLLFSLDFVLDMTVVWSIWSSHLDEFCENFQCDAILDGHSCVLLDEECRQFDLLGKGQVLVLMGWHLEEGDGEVYLQGGCFGWYQILDQIKSELGTDWLSLCAESDLGQGWLAVQEAFGQYFLQHVIIWCVFCRDLEMWNQRVCKMNEVSELELTQFDDLTDECVAQLDLTAAVVVYHGAQEWLNLSQILFVHLHSHRLL